MFDESQDENSNKPKKKGNRVRVREVDFMRVESTVSGQELAPFELEVKSEMASVQSPFAELAAQEDREDVFQDRRISKYRLACLVRKAMLTPRLAECYRLIWIKRLSENQTAKRMGVCQSRVRDMKKIIRVALLTALDKEEKWNQLAIKARFACRTKKQFQIWKLYFKERKTFSEIGRDLKLSRQAVQQLMKRIIPKG